MTANESPIGGYLECALDLGIASSVTVLCRVQALGSYVAKVCDDRVFGFAILLTLNLRPRATWTSVPREREVFQDV
jgi:hypothetical protein